MKKVKIFLSFLCLQLVFISSIVAQNSNPDFMQSIGKIYVVETEMSVHASSLRLPVIEIECDYGRRQEGSVSKLSTFKDGFKILRMMASLMKETRPFIFFSYIALGFLSLSLILAAPVIATLSPLYGCH